MTAFRPAPWQDYAEFLQLLGVEGETGQVLPAASVLNKHLAKSIENRCGKPVQFVPSEELPGVNYEQHIFETGQVSTRANNWHDLFNALVWARYPRTKTALNVMHWKESARSAGAGRGPVRDALTLFDESGVIVLSSRPKLLEELLEHRWHELFFKRSIAWQFDIQVFVLGHALLEKFLQPYKGITAQALVVQVSENTLRDERATIRERMDQWLSARIAAGNLLQSSQELTPLPLMGVPDWAEILAGSVQDESWYRDLKVFRPLNANKSTAAIVTMENYLE